MGIYLRSEGSSRSSPTEINHMTTRTQTKESVIVTMRGYKGTSDTTLGIEFINTEFGCILLKGRTLNANSINIS